MKTKMIIAVTCIVILQLTTATAQISTNVQSGNFGSTFSISIGTNPTPNNGNFNSWNQCCGNNYNNNGWQSNNNCYSNNNCNRNANCCGQKHGHGKHKHKCKNNHGNNNDCGKNSNGCKKHDD